MKSTKSFAILLLSTLLLTSCGSTETPPQGNTGTSNTVETSVVSSSVTTDTKGGENVGKYNIFRYGTGDTAIDGDLLVASGMDKSYIELKNDHTGVFVLSDTVMEIGWTDDGKITTAGVPLYTFTIQDKVLNLDMMGISVTYVLEGEEAPTSVVENGGRPGEKEKDLIPVLSARAFDIYYAYQFGVADSMINCLESGMTPDNTKLQVNKDGSGCLTMAGYDTNIDLADGKVTTAGVQLYTYTVVNSDEIDLDMGGTIYRFLKEGSDAAVAAGLVEGAQAVTRKNYRHLMANEKVLDVDGGVLYYEVFSNEASISYGNVDAKNLYIPAEIEGKPVTSIRRLHGNIENLYLPSGLECIYASFGDFEGIRTLTIGYDGGDCKFKMIRQGCCDYGHFKRDKLEKVVFPASMSVNEDFSLGRSAFGEAYILTEVENIPPAWKEGVESLEKGVEMLKNPSDYIHPQSEKVTKLAQEVTKGLTTDSDKVYAICKWVVDSIVYDITGYDKYLAARDCKYYGGDYNQSDYAMSSVATYPDEVIDKKVAVCEGFSRLTRAMCNAVGIPAVLVSGVLPPKKDSWELSAWHAWNMVYFDGEWKHIDTTFCNKDYNAQVVLTKEGELGETIAKESAITYEEYMNNPELQQDYSWEEIEAINKYTEATQGFDARHYYYCLPALAMGADHIAYYVDDMVIPGVNPLK